MGKINIIGLGPGDVGLLTLNAVEKIKNENKNYLRTDNHGTIDYFKENNIKYTSYDDVYMKKESFEEVYKFIALDLARKSNELNEINYFVPGHPLMGEETTSYLIHNKNDLEIEIEIIEGISFIDTSISTIKRDIVNGLKIIDGLEVNNMEIDINCDNIITQVHNNIIASDVKLALSDIYGDDYYIYILGDNNLNKIKLFELDRIDNFNHLTNIYIPKMDEETRNNYNMYNLVKIMERLRSKDGCPWDIKQNHRSLREYIIEEAYEVVEAIDNDDLDSLVDELGDVLLQVVFHSQIAKEEGYFNVYDIIRNICEKMIHRHPHVFNDTFVKDSHEVISNWNDIKDKEKNISTYTERLESLPITLPSLMKSYKIQKKAAEVGFDWPNIDGAKLKFEEEYGELLEAIKLNDAENIEEELGDIIFALVNISRFLNVNPEIALNKTIKKFISRFRYIEDKSLQNGNDLQEMSLNEMEKLWNMAKIHKK